MWGPTVWCSMHRLLMKKRTDGHLHRLMHQSRQQCCFAPASLCCHQTQQVISLFCVPLFNLPCKKKQQKTPVFLQAHSCLSSFVMFSCSTHKSEDIGFLKLSFGLLISQNRTSVLVLHLIVHCLTAVSVSFFSLIKGIPAKFACCVLP